MNGGERQKKGGGEMRQTEEGREGGWKRDKEMRETGRTELGQLVWHELERRRREREREGGCPDLSGEVRKAFVECNCFGKAEQG